MVAPEPHAQAIAATSRLAIVKSSLIPILAWPLVCVMLVVTIWSLTLSIIRTDREFIDRTARKNASYLATAYAQHLTRLLDQADQLALHVRLDWQQTHGRLKLDTLVESGLFPPGGLLHVSIIDRTGKVLTSSRLPLASANMARMEFFTVPRDAAPDHLHIGPALASGLLDKPAIPLSRRLQDDAGNFDGVVVVSAEPAYFSAYFDSASVGLADLLAVLGNDGALRGSRIGTILYPASSPAIRQMPAMEPARRGVAKVTDGGAFADGEARYLAWQTLSAYPFSALVGLSEPQLLAPYLETWSTYRQGALAASLLLLVLSLTGTVMVVRMTWRHRQSEEIKRTYRIATEGGNEGFYMLRALFDSEREITDFLIEDCNARGAMLIGKERDGLIGTRFIAHRDDMQPMLDVFRKAMLDGFYEDEFQVADAGPLRGSWLHRRLVRCGTGLAMTLRDITAIKNHHNELARVANEDALTALPSRHWLGEFLPEALARNGAAGTMLALLFVDLDGFKSVNDTLGHAAGDELLQQAARRLQSVLRPGDHVVRLGGDEFTAILEPILSETDATRVAVRIVEAFNKPFVLSQGVKSVGTSVGISLFPRDGHEQDALLKNADTAMYCAKAEGKNQYRIYEHGMTTDALARNEMRAGRSR